MLEGAFLSAADYITAQRARAVLSQQMKANFNRVDVFATPMVPRPPEAFDALDPNEQNLRPSFTNPFNLTGLPTISVPCELYGRKIAGGPSNHRSRIRKGHLLPSPRPMKMQPGGMNNGRRYNSTESASLGAGWRVLLIAAEHAKIHTG
jgi:aspartyl-tRNA(Asn)/glutamyl-tRNA(Gln) amidotransferase subunit A